jgi:hypothetical protein
VKSRLPVTAFKHAVADDVSADDMHALREAFQSTGIRLAVLSFIKFSRDSATDYRSASRSAIDSPPTQHLT